MPVYNPITWEWESEVERGDEPPYGGCNGLSDKDADVYSPSHYRVGGYEAIDIIKAKLTPEEYRGYCKGNILKYIMRANYKEHHDQDCRKAAWYSEELSKCVANSSDD